MFMCSLIVYVCYCLAYLFGFMLMYVSLFMFNVSLFMLVDLVQLQAELAFQLREPVHLALHWLLLSMVSNHCTVVCIVCC